MSVPRGSNPCGKKEECYFTLNAKKMRKKCYIPRSPDIDHDINERYVMYNISNGQHNLLFTYTQHVPFFILETYNAWDTNQ